MKRLLTVPVLLLAGCLPFHSGGKPTALQVAAAVARAPADVDSVWPGYALRRRPFLLYRPGAGALLVTSGAGPASFAPAPDSVLPPELRGRAYVHQGALPGLTGAVLPHFPLAGGDGTAVPVEDDLGQTLVTLYHEAFHAYQDEHFAKPAEADEFVPAAQLTAAVAARMEVERRMLDSALDLPPGARLDSLLVRYLAVRQVRSDAWPAQSREVERELERKEGSANLVGYMSAERALGYEPARITRAIRVFLTVPLRRFGGDASSRLIRWRAYGTGAAIGLLLDRAGVQWRHALERGATFDALLANHLAFDTASAGALAPAALTAFGYEALRTTAHPPWGALRAGMSVADFYRLGAVRLVIEISPQDTTYNFAWNFNIRRGLTDIVLGRNPGVERPERDVSIFPRPKLFSTPPATGIALVVHGRPVMVDARPGSPGAFRITVLLPRLPKVDGAVPRAGVTRRAETLSIEGDHTMLRATGHVTLVTAADSVLVRIVPVAGTGGSAPPSFER